MNWFTSTFSSSLGKKLIMSLTGLFLIIFLIGHLVGNLLLFSSDGGQAFNEYAAFMSTNPAIQVLRVITFVSVIFHIIYSVVLTKNNSQARPVGYAKVAPSPNTTWMSRNMGLLGLIVLVFLIIHLRTFLYEMKFGEVPFVEYGSGEVKNLYAIVVEAFSQLWYTALYVIFMIALGLHLAHGFHSSFQTAGVRHAKYTPILKKTGIAFSIIVPALFAAMPIYIYIQSLG